MELEIAAGRCPRCMSFSTLGLGPKLLQSIADLGYTQPTPIQSAAIPHLLTGRDLIGIAQTGTGKTAAFVLPLLERIMASPKSHHPRALILAPTRALAPQIDEQVRPPARPSPPRRPLLPVPPSPPRRASLPCRSTSRSVSSANTSASAAPPSSA